MILAIADSHTTIWYLFSDSRLGKAVADFMNSTIAQGDHIRVSAITIAEIIYLVEKGRIPASAVLDLHDATATALSFPMLSDLFPSGSRASL